ncbi:hypothetical protein GCM10027074_36030 [Streptomyces deserti]
MPGAPSEPPPYDQEPSVTTPVVAAGRTQTTPSDVFSPGAAASSSPRPSSWSGTPPRRGTDPDRLAAAMAKEQQLRGGWRCDIMTTPQGSRSTPGHAASLPNRLGKQAIRSP